MLEAQRDSGASDLESLLFSRYHEPKVALALSKNINVSASALISHIFIFEPICLHTERRHGKVSGISFETRQHTQPDRNI